MSELTCSKCGKVRDKGRRMCRDCFLEYIRQYSKDYHDFHGRYHYGMMNCLICNKEIKRYRKSQKMCIDCSRNLGGYNTNNNYIYAGNDVGLNHWVHRRIAEQLLSRKLDEHEVVHHIDENTHNNEIANLLIISRAMHGKLHHYLRIQRVILEQSKNENLENCWDSLRVPMTTAWLEMTSAKVIKLWEISQSAAEPLNSTEHEEGSETMHQTSLVDEDIVQTATETA